MGLEVLVFFRRSLKSIRGVKVIICRDSKFGLVKVVSLGGKRG